MPFQPERCTVMVCPFQAATSGGTQHHLFLTDDVNFEYLVNCCPISPLDNYSFFFSLATNKEFVESTRPRDCPAPHQSFPYSLASSMILALFGLYLDDCKIIFQLYHLLHNHQPALRIPHEKELSLSPHIFIIFIVIIY